MKFNKKIKILTIIFILISSLILSGCITKKDTTSSIINKKSLSIIDINAPEEAFFNEKIELEVSDQNNKYQSFQWNFQDGTISTGKKVDHIFKFDNKINVEYPFIYTITLFSLDKENRLITTEHKIKLYPKNLTYYLDNDGLKSNNPFYHYKEITDKLLSLNKKEIISYSLLEPIILEKCDFELFLSMDKSFLTKINNVELLLYNTNGTIINDNEEIIIKNSIYKRDGIKIEGQIKNKIKLKSISIELKFSNFIKDIKVIYGGLNPSYISFNF